MSERIFLDFDGTLIDSSRRLYTLFAELVPENSFSYEEYWRIKRNRINQRDFLRRYFDYTDERIRYFKESWMDNIEDPARLATDAPFEGVTACLRQWSRAKTLYLVTARQCPKRAIAQVDALGWSDFFSGILVTRQQQSKAALIREKSPYHSTDILVGDTGEDILAGKELGVKTAAVSSGVLSAEILKEYQPGQLLESVVQLDAA